MSELIVEARWVVTGIADRHTPVVIDNGAVLSRDGLVVAAGTPDDIQRLAPHAAIKRYPNHAMLPGFVNSHHHVGLTRLFDQLTGDNAGQALTRIQLAPANLHWCTDDGLLALHEKAVSSKVPMHMHLLETAYQKEYARRRTGKTAVRYLHDLGVLGPHMTLGHGVWLNAEDIDIVAETGTCICHNCSSNFRLRSGLAPLNVWEKKGITIGMGLDEAGINDDRDMLQELKLALRVHRTPGMDDDVPTAPQIVRMATEGGAKTTPFGDRIGRLDPGRCFDAVLIDWNAATYPFQDEAIPMLDALVQRAKSQHVSAVYIGGEVVYEGGRFTKVDRDEALAEIAALLARPRTPEDEARRELSQAVFPHVRAFYEGYLDAATHVPFYAASSMS